MKIPEIWLRPEPTTPEGQNALGFRWASEDVGKRHKLGGDPQWLSASDWPSCTDCRQPMTFYGQFDSIGDDFALADCGMIYVFVCFDCFTTSSLLQTS